MGRWFRALPGPIAVKALLAFVLAIVILAALLVLFEWAGDLLDNGGTIGAISFPG